MCTYHPLIVEDHLCCKLYLIKDYAIVENRSGNNNHGLPDVYEAYLEDQLIFGKPSSANTTAIREEARSLDDHLQGVPSPAVLYVTSTTAKQNSLSHNHSTEHEERGNPSGGNNNNKTLSEKIKCQSEKHLQAWNEVMQLIKVYIIDIKCGMLLHNM